MALLGLRFCARAFSSCGKWGPLFIAVRGPLTISRPLLLRSTGSRRAGSVVVAHGPSCPAACGIFPDQGLNPCSLHWQADSQPLRHQGSPVGRFLSMNLIYWIYFKVSVSSWVNLDRKRDWIKPTLSRRKKTIKNINQWNRNWKAIE